MSRLRMALLTLGISALATDADAWTQGQTAPGYAPTMRQTAPVVGFKAPGSYQRSTGQNNAALNFYGGTKSLRYAQRPARPLPIESPRPINAAPLTKPFSGVQQAASISPYLALDNIETSTSLPNYFLYVRPRLEQQQSFRVQQAQYLRMQQQQMRGPANGGAPTGVPTASHSDRFMNVGGYYPTPQSN